jgi:hypothetical protein
MSTTSPLAASVGAAAALILAAMALLAPIEVRHSAPFGFSLTLDSRRGIAVRGGFVTPNYPDFNRVDLDLRAYNVAADYDLTVHIRPDQPGAADVRTIALSVPGERIRHDKATFVDPFLTLRFPPIADSVGHRYYVWVEPGPRNGDDVVTLWSVKSYSRARGSTVLAAFLRFGWGTSTPVAIRAALLGLLMALLAGFGWLMAAVTTVALEASQQARSPGRRPWPTRKTGGIH